MGNEVSTIGGAMATVGTSFAAGVTFGQVKKFNDAVVECAKFTGNAASKTVVRHYYETAGSAVATGATAVAAGVTFGQVDAINQAVKDCAKHTVKSSVEYNKALVHTASDLADGTPGVGHVKGVIHYKLGDIEGGDAAMKAASRTVGVVAGGVAGAVVGGPVGAVAGGIAGGAAMDGITTGVESAIEGKYVPSGQIKAWTDVAEGKDAQTVIGGVVGGLAAPVMDGVGGYSAGRGVMKARAAALVQDLAGFEAANEQVPRNANPALNEFMAEQQRNAGRGARNSAFSEPVPRNANPAFINEFMAEQQRNAGRGARSRAFSEPVPRNANPAFINEFMAEQQRNAGRGAAGTESRFSGPSATSSTFSEPVPRNANPALNEFMAEQQRNAGRGAAGEGDATSFLPTESTFSGPSATCTISAFSWSVASSVSWKNKLLETANDILCLSELDDVVLYRGVNKGLSLYTADDHDKELCDGIYLIDSLEIAEQNATSQKPTNKRVPGEVYKYLYRADDGKNYMKYWMEKHGGKVDMDDFKIIKTKRGDHYEYRFSPHLAQVLEEKKALKLCIKLE